jgi:DNA invertase Pin-like site-specific DNA recombinase
MSNDFTEPDLTNSVEFVPTLQNAHGIKAFAYLRVSGKGQISGDGFPRQREAVADYATRHTIALIREYRDEGVSGTKDSFERDGLTELMLAVKAEGIKLVICERADRLARDLMIGEILLGEFRKLGVQVIAADSETDLTVENGDPTRTLMRQMLGAIAQWEKSVIVQKLYSARARIRKTKGRCEGRKLYGVSEHEQTVIRLVLNYQQQSMTVSAIARRLNADGVSPRTKQRAGRPTKWHPAMIQRILARMERVEQTT